MFKELRRSIAYFRVSSKEQAENMSLTNQKEACFKYAMRSGLTIVRSFSNCHGESAKTMDRDALKEMISYVVAEKGKIESLIIWKFDRLARNMGDFLSLIKLFEGFGVTILSATEQADNTPSGKFLRNILGSAAQFDNDVKTERTITGMKQALKEGRWIGRPPVGYLYKRGSDGKSILVPSEDSRYVVEAFNLAETGIYRVSEICKKLELHGFNVYKQKLTHILKNPIYAGLISAPKWFDSPIKGIHESLVSEECFYQVGRIIEGKKQSSRIRLRNHPDFPLRNFITCPKCEKPITGGFSTSRNKKRHAYYHCRVGRCGFGSVKRDDLHRGFLNQLSLLKPKGNAIKLFKAILEDVWNSNTIDSRAKHKELSSKITSLENKKKRAVDKLLKGTLSDDIYSSTVRSIDEDIMSIKIAIEDLKIGSEAFDDYVIHGDYAVSNPDRFWEEAGLDVRQRFQSLVFPNGIDYFNGSFGTARTSIVFSVLHGINMQKSIMAPPVGLEPTAR